MNFCKVIDVRDFEDPELVKAVREALPYLASAYPDFPLSNRIAKAWEIGMTVRALDAFGLLNGKSEVLGVAAGTEATLFYLTTRVKRVFATDLYASAGAWNAVAPPAMLIEPESCAVPGSPFDARRLVTQHMDARRLRFPDGCFDAVFSTSSIEHFGQADDIIQAAKEMGRVLKPGGLLCLTTEYRMAGPSDGLGIPGVVLFTREMLENWIIQPSGLALVEPLDTTADTRTLSLAYPLAEAVQKGIRPTSVVVEQDGFIFGPVFVLMRKRDE